jgi:autotransporter-associated beta strand protein
MKKNRCAVSVLLCAACLTTADAAVLVWKDAGVDNVWDDVSLNWDGGGTAWVDGSTAQFQGAGGAVAVPGAVTAAGITFLSGGYTVGGAGTLTLSGAPSVNAMVAGTTNELSVSLAGADGFTKSGAGVLVLSGGNGALAGQVRVSQGLLRLSYDNPTALGATGAGNETIVENGSTLDIASAYRASISQDFIISGTGWDGRGAFVNNGQSVPNYNVGVRHITLAGDATIGGAQRFDLWDNGAVNGNGFTLTKDGANEIAINRSITNCTIVIKSGMWTIQGDQTLGGADFPTYLQGGSLNIWGQRTVRERVFASGGAFAVNSGSTGTNLSVFAGPVTLNGGLVNFSANGSATNRLMFTGGVDGTGGVNMQGTGAVILSGTNTYAGPTTVTCARGGYIGMGDTLSGTLVTGTITNSSLLFIDNTNTVVVCTNGLLGGNTIRLRYGASLTLDGGSSTQSAINVSSGTLALTNGANLRLNNSLILASRSTNEMYFSKTDYEFLWPSPTGCVAVVNLAPDSGLLSVSGIVIGNEDSSRMWGGTLTGIVNQAGGTVQTTGNVGEENGIRLGHYPQARGFYTLSGGTLRVGNDWELCLATDGQGTFTVTGGDVFAKRIMLNERDGNGGYGTLRLMGGVLNVGSPTGSHMAVSNGIAADVGAPYLAELGGGAGGTIRAVTNVLVSVNATLLGAGASAVTFDSAEWNIEVSGNLTGAGGLTKDGVGTLTLSGNNTYAGVTRVLCGKLVRAVFAALPVGNVVEFGVADDDSGGRIHAYGDLSLEGLTAGVANPEMLDTAKRYTVATWGGSLTARFSGIALPAPWYVYTDTANKRLQIRADVGTVLLLK